MQIFVSYRYTDTEYLTSPTKGLMSVCESASILHDYVHFVEEQEQSVSDEVFFEVSTPLGFRVRVTLSRWEVIVSTKHPVMRGQEVDVQTTLQDPDQVRRSRSDPAVHLFYRLIRPGRWICAVAKRLNSEGFLITTYPTDAIKEGDQIWSK